MSVVEQETLDLIPMVKSLKVLDKKRRIVDFVPNWAQVQILEQVRKDYEAGRPTRIICLKARQIGICLDPRTRVLTEDLRWVPMDEVHPGDAIVAVDEEPPGGRGLGRKMRTAVVEAKRDVYEDAYRLTMSNGETLVATGAHRFLSRFRSGTDTCWRRVKKFGVGDDIRFITQPWSDVATYEDGWFGGLLDGEGCCRQKSRAGVEVSVSQRPGAVFDRALSYLKERGYHFREEVDSRKAGESSKFGSVPVARAVINRMNELFRLMGQTRPSRFIDRRWWEGKDLPGKKTGEAWAKVISIEPLGPQRMVDLQTSTKTFIAEGFVSHNSTITEAIIFCKAVMFPHTEAVVASLDTEQAEYLFDMTKRFYDSWAYKSFYPPRYTSKRQLFLEVVESDINVKTGENPKSFRGRTYTDAHISEVAFWTKPVEAMLAINQGMPAVRGNFQLIESCVTGDTLVTTGAGLKSIRELVPEPVTMGHQDIAVEVLSRGEWRKADQAFVNGIAPTLKITTKYGYEVEATRRHKLLVLHEGELVWRQTDELQIGDHICISYLSHGFGDDALDFVPPSKKGTRGNTERFTPGRMTPDLGYLLGLYLAEGYASKKPVRTVITSSDEEIHIWLEQWGFKRKDEFHSWWFRRDFVDFLDHVGLDPSRRAWGKTLSDRVLGFSRETLRGVLQGLFDGDGTIHSTRKVIGYVTTSRELAGRIQSLLLSFGVVSRLYARPHGPESSIDGRNFQGKRDVYTLEVSGPFYDTFMDHIGFRLERKQGKRITITARGVMIPGMWKKLRTTLGGYGKKEELFRKAGVHSASRGKAYYRDAAMSRPTLISFLEAGAELDSEIADYFYDPVVTIEPGEAETFDLCVPGTRSYVANGIVSHNTANGMGNHFEEEYWRAKKGESDYTAFFFPWFLHYEYIPCRGEGCHDGTCAECEKASKGIRPKDSDERELIRMGASRAHLAWRRWAIPNLCMNNVDLFMQEYPATDEEAFIASGVNAFNLDDLKAVYQPQEPTYGDLVVKSGQVRFLPDPQGPFRIYKLPDDKGSVADKKWGEYFVGADACYGVIDGDWAGAHVINRRTKEQVAVYHARISPGELADKLALLGKFYGGSDPASPGSLPVIAVETEGPGIATIERLRMIYPRVWARRSFDSLPGTDRSEQKLGWSTSWKTKAYLVLSLAEMVQKSKLTIHDERTFKELRTYSFFGGRGYIDKFGPGDAARGRDDLVMSLAITMVCESAETPVGAYEVVDSPDGVIWSREQEKEAEWE